MFFSDAVLAIALTLLAIDLPLPPQGSSAEMLRAAGEDWPEYLAFLISFAVIGGHWRLHHLVFRDVRATSTTLVRLNQNWLLMAVVTPFLTRLLSEGDLNAVRFVPYAVAQAIQSSLMVVMIAVVRRDRPTGEQDPARRLGAPAARSLAFALGFALSVPAYLLVGSWAFVLWAAAPLAARAAHVLVRRRRHGPTEATPGGPPAV